MFGILWFLLLRLLQAHGGELEENNDGWRFLLMAVMETTRAGGELEESVAGLIQKQGVCELWRGYGCPRANGIAQTKRLSKAK